MRTCARIPLGRYHERGRAAWAGIALDPIPAFDVQNRSAGEATATARLIRSLRSAQFAEAAFATLWLHRGLPVHVSAGRPTLSIYTHAMRRKHDDSAELAGLAQPTATGTAPTATVGNVLETGGSVEGEEAELSDCFYGSPAWARTNDQRITPCRARGGRFGGGSRLMGTPQGGAPGVRRACCPSVARRHGQFSRIGTYCVRIHRARIALCAVRHLSAAISARHFPCALTVCPGDPAWAELPM